MRLRILVAGGLVWAYAASAAASAATADLKGVWRVEDQTGEIEIADCTGLLWGIVVWERTPGRDTENPDPALRGRPTLGMPILLGMRPVVEPHAEGPQTIWRGQIYNSRNGKTYDASIKPVDADTLHLEGCVLGGLFCGGQNWTRVKPPTVAPPAIAGDVCSRISDLARRPH
ncbi:MAG TPA: DUF2147 domain-containing protein [Xanthobacteraceae bacterium]|nr:DUF2147 domain-containing protein [Xanthobacteraceae bacterium]